MKLIYTLFFISSFWLVTNAQENKTANQQFPQFEECEQDDQSGKSCFENTFQNKFKKHYRDVEIATDYSYDREVEGTFTINRRGTLVADSFNSTESPIFIALDRATNRFPKLIPVQDEKGRKVDFNFQINFKLKRTKRLDDSALHIEIKFIYPENEEAES